ncbi:hypothetical protein I302_109030 [Kwoniella bestiolae CBS 10118]|uniref:diphosphoinositol-polyphosphate diphosphatase n=1 Tax=Kwoniella bestiolae CBS 10118 TaxID=1296100 RepID=A0A1B9FUS5_9TREE|nr:tyrosine specific protein phosphatase [Kwoniella bestiolae CBS 10118]OCF22523.1 tyrosine specific protein phosphatase [Kwoniella bestiolae CBS 10118]
MSSPPPSIPPFLATILSSRLASSPLPTAGPSTSNPKSTNPSPTPGSSTTISQPQPPNPLYLPPPALPKVEEDLVPPENFSLVSKGVYRSGFPKKRNFGFMETLRLKTVLTLVLEDYPEANLEWCQSQDIQFMQFGIPGNKEPFDNIPEDVICSALVAILDVRNHPVLIHCNKGKHRTGCLIGCIRRLQSWSLTSIFDEYRRFSSPKSRAVDQQFIDLFDLIPVWNEVIAKGGGVGNLPEWGMLTLPRRGVIAQRKEGQIPDGAISMSMGNGKADVEEEDTGEKGDAVDGITSLRLDQQQRQQYKDTNKHIPRSPLKDNPDTTLINIDGQDGDSNQKSINDILHLEDNIEKQPDQDGIINIDVNVDGIDELKKVDGVLHLTSKVEEVVIN